MARVYVCDACGVTMINPYKAKMREFYVVCGIDCEHCIIYDTKKTRRHKIHLCNDCYHALHEIAAGKVGEVVK